MQPAISLARGLRAALPAVVTLIAVALIAVPAAAQSQPPFCTASGGTQVCSASGSIQGQVNFTSGSNGNNLIPLTGNSTASISVVPNSGQNTGISTYDAAASPGGSAAGGSAGSVSITNSGAISLINAIAPIQSGSLYGLFTLDQAGSGNGGGNAGPITITNSGGITISVPSIAIYGGAVIWATSNGGNTTGSGQNNAGAGGAVTLVNSGAIDAAIMGSNGYAGLYAQSGGGSAPSPSVTQANSANGGDSGLASVTNSMPVNLSWTWSNPVSQGGYGLYGILARSVAGSASSNEHGSGNSGTGAAGNSGGATVSLGLGGNVSLTSIVPGAAPPTIGNGFIGAGIFATATGGAGGNSPETSSSSGNAGGTVAGIQVNITDANVTTSGDGLPAILAVAQAGAGGGGGCSLGPINGQNCNNDTSENLNGGSGGTIATIGTGTVNVTAATQPVGISTNGNNAPGIVVSLTGGAGGNGGSQVVVGEANGGDGASGGTVTGSTGLTINLAGENGTAVSLNTAGSYSPGIYALSVGGDGGDGGVAKTTLGPHAYAGHGGTGGDGSAVTVNLASASIATLGDFSPGIAAQSQGGLGGAGGEAIGAGDHPGDGGNGGGTGTVSVTLDSNSRISTQGTGSMGILAQTMSGAGGGANGGAGINTTGAGGGAGGASGAVTVANNGGTINTIGTQARGILAQSMGGSGGAGGSANSVFSTKGGAGGSAGPSGAVTVTNSGTIATAGTDAQGILAQSIGGTGGAGGQASGVFYTVGGTGGTDPFQTTGNNVAVTSSGSIATLGGSSIGVLGQSIGGGGGDGGAANGIAVTIGGSGSNGGNGGQAGATLAGGTVTTSGDNSPAVVMQSIGGGGGNGGNSSSAGVAASVTLGGSGGAGGPAGAAGIVDNGANIATAGSKSPGLVAQAIGGGGGTGGNALGGAVGVGVSAAVALGGSGGIGGNGGASNTMGSNPTADAAAITVSGGSIATGQTAELVNGTVTASSPCPSLPCNALPIDNYGVVVQSIGGGGGLGGSSVAKALTIAVPISPSGSSFGGAVAVSLGGTGGAAGNGGQAEFSLTNGGTISTRGQGSTGVLVQSIGGGGGAGGDSSALSVVAGYQNKQLPDKPSTTAVDVTYTHGGSGGGGGGGGNVNVAIGGTVSNGNFLPATGPASSITTYGDDADGVKAQSIGGGGGDAGMGSGNTQQFGAGTSYDVNLTMGSSGGSGGGGGTVQVNLYGGSPVTTYGSGAVGVLAQSIGGGGGASQGGSLSVSVSSSETLKLGMSGGTGYNGGSVAVSVNGPVQTHGGDATAVLAQSIGGGGGLGGSAGSDGSGDNPITTTANIRQQASAIASYAASLGNVTTNLAVSLGGSGGYGGDGGNVTISSNAQIVTTGDWANGVVAQSIGGGGGKAGTAVATGTGSSSNVTVNLDYALGGSGGIGGSGGAALITLNEPISTSGFGAAAVIAQSVGGGGGIGADGSDRSSGTITVGAGLTGSTGTASSAGPATVNYANPNGMLITTTGAAADGVVVQSVGGGGGIGGAGSSAWPYAGSGSLTLTAGGSAGSNGNGGNVTFAPTGNGYINISTQGYNAFGVLAQSVGGGGGSIITSRQTNSIATNIGGTSSGSGGDAGTVTVNLGSNSNITTSGNMAFGIAAQSVGGGGGVIRVVGYSTDVAALEVGSSQSTTQTYPTAGNGNFVYVTNAGTVTANGPGSIAIFAQSVGGGGGLISNGNGLYAGSPNQGACNSDCKAGHGYPVSVTIASGGNAYATGQNGIGIFAQSAGPITSAVNVSVAGNVVGGSSPQQGGTNFVGGSAGIWIDSNSGNQVTVEGGGVVTSAGGANGTAIATTGGGQTNVSNSGTITGNLYLSGGTESNHSNATYNAGPLVQGSIANDGVVNLGMPGGGVPMGTHVTGDFTQSGSGQINVIVDSLNKAASHLQVDGTANVAGTIVPSAVTLLPGAIPVVTAGTLANSATVGNSLLFNWDVASAGNTLTLSPTAHFAPQGVALTASEASLAGYLGKAFTNSDAQFATRFAQLSTLNNAGQYKTMLDAYSGKATEAQSIALVNSSGTILGAALSCPVFVDQNVQLGEDNCVWAKVTGEQSNQWETDDTQGYHVSGVTYRLGGQHEIAPLWYLGTSFGVSQSWATTNGTSSGSSSGHGQAYDGSVSLKHTMGPWLFAGSVAFAGGSYQSNRVIDIPGTTASLQGSPGVFMAGGRLRAGYEFAFSGFYVRPYGDLDVLYSDLPGFHESGPALTALDVHGSSKTTVGISPMVEIGGRVTLNDTTTLRPFAAVGISFLPDNTRAIDASFVGASAADGTFRSYVNSPDVLGKVSVGVQMMRAGAYELRAEYDASIGGSYLSQGASARFAYHF